jgi:hypothetical protein
MNERRYKMSFDPVMLALMKKQLPCYDNRKTEPLTIEWDGEIGGRETTSFMFEPFVKLSEATPTYEEIVQATIRFSIVCDVEFAFLDAREEGMPFAAYCNAEGMPLCLFIFDNFEMEGMVFSKGIYSLCKETDFGKLYVEYLHLPSVTTGELKTIDPKFLPVGGGLPVVEITSAPYPIAERLASDDSLYIPVSAEENEQLTKAASQGLPVIIKFFGDMGEGQIVPLCYVFNNMMNFILEARCFFTGLDIAFINDGNGWNMGR